jgi:hypothetical protein
MVLEEGASPSALNAGFLIAVGLVWIGFPFALVLFLRRGGKRPARTVETAPATVAS